jgi:response regulator RpfG family c-di-GMP phosphodiesterase
MMKKYEILLAQSGENSYHPMILERTLEEKGYQVTTVSGSGSGIEALGKKDFDLVITDLSVVLEKAKEVNPEMMTILMLTTERKFMLTVHSIRSAADDYLFVPFELSELEVRVASCIERLERRRRDRSQERMNDTIQELMKILSYDIRESLLSMAASLKLLTQGFYGQVNKEVAEGLNKLLSKMVGLIRVTEECVGETLSVTGEVRTRDEFRRLSRVIRPLEREFASEVNQHPGQWL